MRLISAASVLLLLCLPADRCCPPRAAPDPGPGPDPDPWGEPWGRPCPAGGPEEPRRRPRSPAGRPNSLDLTFHLLREFLELSREERLAQRARSNKWLLQSIGK